MGQLTSTDLHAALELALETQAANTLAELREGLLPALARLVPCDSLGYNEIDVRGGTALGIVDPPGTDFPGMSECFMRVSGQHPLLARQAAGELHTQALSDHLSARRFHRLELYQDFYRQIEAEDQLAFGLGGELVVAFALCRSRRSFTQRDRDVLELVRPHIATAYHQVRRREQELGFLGALEEELGRLRVGVIVLDPRGRVTRLTAMAEELLAVHLAEDVRCGARLPARLSGWIDGDLDAMRPDLVIGGGCGRLRIRDAPASLEAGRTVILTEERSELPELGRLCELGLTRRQAEVLRLLAAGMGNRAIAAELGISVETVGKHLENIYARLGVHSRTQALALARLP